MRTVELRVLQKAINTMVLARALAWHPAFGVRCGAVEGNENFALRERLTVLGLPAPLFTIDLDTELGRRVGREAFQRFFDCLEPAFGLQVTLGQSNTVVRLPGAHESLGAVGAGAARCGHHADHHPDLGRRRRPAHAAGAPDEVRRDLDRARVSGIHGALRAAARDRLALRVGLRRRAPPSRGESPAHEAVAELSRAGRGCCRALQWRFSRVAAGDRRAWNTGSRSSA